MNATYECNSIFRANWSLQETSSTLALSNGDPVNGILCNVNLHVERLDPITQTPITSPFVNGTCSLLRTNGAPSGFGSACYAHQVFTTCTDLNGAAQVYIPKKWQKNLNSDEIHLVVLDRPVAKLSSCQENFFFVPFDPSRPSQLCEWPAHQISVNGFSQTVTPSWSVTVTVGDGCAVLDMSFEYNVGTFRTHVNNAQIAVPGKTCLLLADTNIGWCKQFFCTQEATAIHITELEKNVKERKRNVNALLEACGVLDGKAPASAPELMTELLGWHEALVSADGAATNENTAVAFLDCLRARITLSQCGVNLKSVDCDLSRCSDITTLRNAHSTTLQAVCRGVDSAAPACAAAAALVDSELLPGCYACGIGAKVRMVVNMIEASLTEEAPTRSSVEIDNWHTFQALCEKQTSPFPDADICGLNISLTTWQSLFATGSLSQKERIHSLRQAVVGAARASGNVLAYVIDNAAALCRVGGEAAEGRKESSYSRVSCNGLSLKN